VARARGDLLAAERAMSLRDISIAMAPGTPEWPGDTPFACSWAWRMARGDSVNVSAITTSPHVGTHADAPLHVHDGWPGAEELPLDAFHGPALVRTVPTDRELLELDDIGGVPHERLERLLLRTGCSIADGRFPERWPALSPDAAGALVRQGLRLLGTDAPSVDPRTSTSLAVHHELFRGGAYILENLDLHGVSDGAWELTAYPVKISGADAAPVRAILRELRR
jgi:arylformamidase